jgi:glutathione S-transferase
MPFGGHLKLYYHPFSPNARRPRIVARLLGLAIEEQLVDLTTGANRKPEYLAINPNGKVPALVDGDFVLWESNAIDIYLCRTAGDTTLWPADPRGQADVARWMMWTHSLWSPPIGTVVFETLVKRFRGMEPDAARVAAAMPDIHMVAKVADDHLGQHRFLAGDHLTLADVSCAPNLAFQKAASLPLEGYANLQRWYAELSALDAFKETAPQL